MPRFTAVGADFEALHRQVGVKNLRAEPVFAGAVLVVKAEWGGYAASDRCPSSIDDASGRISQPGEGVLEEVEVVFAAIGTLVDNLQEGSIMVSNL